MKRDNPMNQPKNPFECGGTITNLDAAIERTEIDEVTTALFRGEYVSVLAPQQSGKSTFLKQLQKRIEERHQTKTVYIGFEENTYKGGIKEVVTEFSQRVNTATSSSPSSSTAVVDSNLVDFLNSTTPKPLVFLVDELPSPEDTAFRFLCEVRAYYNENSKSRHLFVFAGPIDLAEFSQAQNSFVSPFNIARTIYLKDFQEEQIKTWVTKLVGDGFFSDLVIQKVFEYTGGQPFLVQFLYSYLHSLPTNEARETKLANLVTLIQDSQVENTPNIKTMVDKVLDTREWRDLLGRILENPQIPFTTSNKIVRNLYLNGCIRENRDGYCQLRNPIYAKIFEENYKILRASSSSASITRKRESPFIWVTISVWEGNTEIRQISDQISGKKIYRLQAGKDYQFKVTLSNSNFEPPPPDSQSLKMDENMRKQEVEFEVELESFFNLGLREMARAKSVNLSEEGMWSFVFPIQPGNKTISGDNTIKAVPVFVNLYQERLPVKVIKQLIEVN
jgi:energy-coupling factor transporter ATP-binding protein EcfA2